MVARCDFLAAAAMSMTPELLLKIEVIQLDILLKIEAIQLDILLKIEAIQLC